MDDYDSEAYWYRTFRVYDLDEWVHPSLLQDPLDELLEALSQVWKTNPDAIQWNARKYRKQAPW